MFPGSVQIFPPAGKADPSWEYIIRSQTHECGNWDWDSDIPFLRIFVSNFRHFVFAVRYSLGGPQRLPGRSPETPWVAPDTPWAALGTPWAAPDTPWAAPLLSIANFWENLKTMWTVFLPPQIHLLDICFFNCFKLMLWSESGQRQETNQCGG